MSTKKVNPRRRPTTEEDIKRARSKATDEAMRLILYMVLYVLVDKHAAPKEDIQQLAAEVNYVADSVNKGYIKWQDIRHVLEDEYDIHLSLR